MFVRTSAAFLSISSQENGPNPGEIGAANLGRLWGQNRCTIQPRRQQRGCSILLMS